MAELEKSGKRRSAARLVAKRLAIDPKNPAEIEIIAQHLRRLRRKKNEQCSFRSELSE